MTNPLDIRRHEFSRAWRGYDRAEVHALLDALAAEFAEAARRREDLAARLKAAEEELDRYRDEEKIQREAALSLQRMLEEKRLAAERETEGLLADGRRKAAEEENAAQARLTLLRGEMQRLDEEKSRFYLRFQDLLNRQSELLESWMQSGTPRNDAPPEA